jgi:tetratricopeptide (TPR) repeat protein
MTLHKIGLSIAGCLFLALPASAQLTALEGYIKNADGTAAANTMVKLIRTDVNRTYPVKTDKKGHYMHTSLPIGFYAVVVAVEGKDVAGISGIRSQPGDPLMVSIDLGASPQDQVRRVKSDLTKMGAEWSYVRSMTAQPGPASQSGTGLPSAPAAKTGFPAGEQRLQEPKPDAAQETQMKAGQDARSSFAAGLESLGARRYPEAVAELTKASELNPKDALIWANLGTAYAGQAGTKAGPEFDSTMEKALGAYGKSVELKPNDAITHGNYALALAKARRLIQMHAELKILAELDPAQVPRACYNIGSLLVNTGQSEAALEVFKTGIAAAPNDAANAETYFQYGIALMSKATVGDGGKLIPAAGTKESFRKYLELAPTGPNAQAAKDLLGTI